VSGLWAESWLREKVHIQVEMSDVFNLLLLVTFVNWQSDVNYLYEALTEMKEYIKKNPGVTHSYSAIQDINPFPFIPDLVMPPGRLFGPPTLLSLQTVLVIKIKVTSYGARVE